jgi:hypothetical protein
LLAVMIASVSLFGGWCHAQAAPTGVGETAHFWYRLAPKDGPYIDTQRGAQAFGLGNGKILFSEDNARNWPHETSFPDARHINFSCILGNGNDW